MRHQTVVVVWLHFAEQGRGVVVAWTGRGLGLGSAHLTDRQVDILMVRVLL